ncbi:hypothetical protein [Marinovum sp. B10]|uniref:hypothetical protein n=1 Tax=Marinovum sp. B10 TaxID=3449224 RepID=UPI003EDC6BA9
MHHRHQYRHVGGIARGGNQIGADAIDRIVGRHRLAQGAVTVQRAAESGLPQRLVQRFDGNRRAVACLRKLTHIRPPFVGICCFVAFSIIFSE